MTLLLVLVTSFHLGLAVDLMTATVDVAKKIKDSVVTISSLQAIRLYSDIDSLFAQLFPELFGPSQMERIGLGSGVIIDKDGYILTNEHVIGPAMDIMVTLPSGNEYHAKVVAVDYKADLAVLKIDPHEEIVPAKLGDSDTVKIGQWVMAVGNPFGMAFHSAEPTLTIGIVSAVHRSLPEAMWRGRNYVDLIQTDAAINPGNSGGPLVNMEGEVIGINVAIVSPSGGSVGVGFAIPINAAQKVIKSALEGRPLNYGWLGITGQDVTSDLQRYFGLDRPMGVVVTSVIEGSPADRAGLRMGDLILRFDGKRVRDMQDLLKFVSEKEVGEVAVLDVVRSGKRMQIKVRIGKRGEGFVNRRQVKSRIKRQGFGGPVNIKGMHLDEIMGKVVVVDVDDNSPAKDSGIKKGDVIRMINQSPIEKIDDIESIPEGELKGNILVKTDRGFFVIFDEDR